jgi:hypothetical protein
MSRKLKWGIVLVAVVLILYPFKTTVAPEQQFLVVTNDMHPVKDALVRNQNQGQACDLCDSDLHDSLSRASLFSGTQSLALATHLEKKIIPEKLLDSNRMSTLRMFDLTKNSYLKNRLTGIFLAPKLRPL